MVVVSDHALDKSFCSVLLWFVNYDLKTNWGRNGFDVGDEA